MDFSRYEINRLVRVVLTQHGADLALADSSFIGGTVYLSGTLQKSSGEQFVPGAIDEMAKDISRLSGVRDVQFDLENWFLNRGHGAWQIRKGKGRHVLDEFTSHLKDGTTSTGATVEIKSGDKIADVLEDMKKKERERNEKHD